MIRPFPRQSYFLAVGVSCFLALICLLIFLEAKKQLHQELRSQANTVGNMVVTDIERTVRSNINSLESLKDRIEESDGEFMQYFESDAARITKQHPAIKFVEWIDRDGIIRQIYPLEENRAAYLLDIKPIEYRYSDWLHNSKNELSNMTAWVTLTQKGNAFLVDVPIFVKDEFYGTVSAGMDFQSQFNDVNKNLKNLNIQLVDEEGNEFYSLSNLSTTDVEDSFEYYSSVRPIPEKDKTWDFRLQLVGNALHKERDIIQKTGLSYGILISILVGLLVIYFLRLKQRNTYQYEMNTKLKQLNIELEKQKRAAQEASLHKSDFISNMSHEIRTPLNAILGFVEILREKKLLRNERLYLKLMKNSAQNLLGLVNNILDINIIEAGKAVISNDIFKPLDAFKKVVSTYESQIEANKLSLEIHISENDNHSVVSDSSRFNQIVTNILSNAIKFTVSGAIRVYYNEYVEDEKLMVQYIISDTGVGIPKSKLDAIFKRFVQVENGTRKRHEGGGLGLAITHELVQLLGGTIKVQSEESKGSSFSVSLAMPLALEHQHINTTEIPDLSSLKCLIVDDNRINRMILFNFLQKTGIHIDSVGSGEEALQKVQTTTYDLIFMDIHMPVMNGFETTHKLLEISPSSTVYGVSADVTVEAIQKGKQAGMTGYLTKPIDRELLYKTLNDLVMV